MADLPKPVAARLQKPSWRDPRLLVGVLLVLLSVLLGAKVVAAADDRVPMYAAAVTLVPGQMVTQQDVRRVDVQLGGGDLYLGAGQEIAADTFALREIRPGELLPRTALGARSEVDVKPVTVSVDTAAAGTLTTGSVVDVWVNPRLQSSTSERYGKPSRSLQAASVARVPELPTGLAGSTGTLGVQILVPDDQVQDLIAAIDQGAKVTLVPVPGSPRRAGS